MAALRDKIWVRHEGKNYRADVSRVEGMHDPKRDDHTPLAADEVDANLYERSAADEGGITHNHLVGGLSHLKLAKTDAEKTQDGHWWPREGQWVNDPAHGGRRGWQEG